MSEGDDLSIKRKINILKNFLLILIIALFYTISSYNISKAVAASVSSSTSVNTVTTDAHHLNLITGNNTVTLTATVLPSNASNKAVTWSSSNNAVATVSSSGVVTPIAAGIAIVTVRTVDGGYADACVVTVTTQEVTGISLSSNGQTLKVGSSLTLNPVISPSDASNKTVIWSSSNTAVATVSSSGVVTAIAPGVAAIWGKTADQGYSTYFIVTVPEAVTSLTLSQSSLNFNLGDPAVTLSATLKPDSLWEKEVTWSSSNYSVADVDSNGTVTPVSSGTATVTVTSVADNTKKATCTVTVGSSASGASNIIHPQSITLSLHTEAAVVGTTFTLSDVISPSNAANTAVTWSSTNPGVATVSSSGVVTAIAPGTTIIVVKTVDGGCTDACMVNVTTQEVTGISLSSNGQTLKVGSTLTLNPVITPSNASNKTVIWSSSNTAVATVSSSGVVTAIAPGVAGILGKTVDQGYSTYFIVTVPEVVTSLTLSQSSLNFNVGGPAVTLSATLKPDSLWEKEVTWSSSNYGVANVDSNGTVTPVSSGTATITVTSVADNTKKATCTVTVGSSASNIIHPQSITLSSHEKAAVAGTTFTLSKVMYPSNAANTAVTWSSTNPAVATVSSSGVVTPIAAGTTMIVVKTVDGGCTDACMVNVTTQEVTGISLSSNGQTLKVGSTLTLNPVITPSNASNKTVVWSSSNTAVATVSSSGVVTAIAPGVAGILGKTVDQGYSTYFIVTVPEAVTSLTLSESSLKFNLGDPGVTLSATLKPDSLWEKDVTWSSSNYGIANVDSNGTVTPVSSGTATITVTSVADNTKKATCTVTVGSSEANIIHPQSITLSSHVEAAVVGTTFTLSKVMYPSNAANTAVTWSSTNPAVATVSSSGVVTPIAAGTALIVVKAVDGGCADGCLVTVTTQEVTGISLSSNGQTLKIGSTVTLNPVITPSNASNKTVIWSSSNAAVATVSSSGVVTAISPGVAVIFGKTADQGYTTCFVVNVPETVDSVTLSQSSLKFNVGDPSVTLSYTIKPDTLSQKDVYWTSNNYNVATVDSNGKVTPVSAGTATITVTSVEDNTKKATCTVTVLQHAQGVIIS
jgi:uncharacterized protein YjdB